MRRHDHHHQQPHHPEEPRGSGGGGVVKGRRHRRVVVFFFLVLLPPHKVPLHAQRMEQRQADLLTGGPQRALNSDRGGSSRWMEGFAGGKNISCNTQKTRRFHVD